MWKCSGTFVPSPDFPRFQSRSSQSPQYPFKRGTNVFWSLNILSRWGEWLVSDSAWLGVRTRVNRKSVLRMGPQMNGWRRHRWWIGPEETFRQQVICNWVSTDLPAIKRVFCFCIFVCIFIFPHVYFIILVWQLNLNSNWNWRWFQFWTIVQLWSLSIVKVVELPRLNEIGLL